MGFKVYFSPQFCITELANLPTPTEMTPLWILRRQFLADFSLLLLTFLLFLLESDWWKHRETNLIRLSLSSHHLQAWCPQASSKFWSCFFLHFCFFLQLCDSTYILCKFFFFFNLLLLLKVTLMSSAPALFMVAAILGGSLFFNFISIPSRMFLESGCCVGTLEPFPCFLATPWPI